MPQPSGRIERGHSAAPFEHERRQRVHQAGVLGEADEIVRQQPAELGMIPPHQRFDRTHGVGAEVNDRLVVEDELAAVDRLPHRRGQAGAAAGSLIARRVVDHVAGLVFLGEIHRRVGLLQHFVARGRVPRHAGDADAGADDQRPAVGDEGMLQVVQDLARGQLRAIDVGGRQQHRELVAAEPRDRVGRAQAPRSRVATSCSTRSPA